MNVGPDARGFDEPFARASSLRPDSDHPLQHAAARLAEFREGASAFKARDLVGLLLSHGARAYRASQPPAVVRIRVRGAGSDAAVRLRLA